VSTIRSRRTVCPLNLAVPLINAIAFTPQWDEMLSGSRRVVFQPEVKAVIVPTLHEIEGDSLVPLEKIIGKKIFAVG